MASIQQSFNTLLGAVAGAATAGSYMYRQSPTYKAKQIEKAAEGEAKIAAAQSVTDEDLAAGAKVANRASNKSPLSAIRLTTEETIAGRESQLKPELARAESLEQSAKEAYLTNPTKRNLNKYLDTSYEAKKQRANMEAFQRLKENVLSQEFAEYEIEERKELLKQKDWQKNLSSNLNAPGDTSADRLKLAKITRDIRYKEKNKGEID